LNNPYAQYFRSLKDIPNLKNFKILLRFDVDLDQTIYNMPTAYQVASLLAANNDSEDVGKRDILLM